MTQKLALLVSIFPLHIFFFSVYHSKPFWPFRFSILCWWAVAHQRIIGCVRKMASKQGKWRTRTATGDRVLQTVCSKPQPAVKTTANANTAKRKNQLILLIKPTRLPPSHTDTHLLSMLNLHEWVRLKTVFGDWHTWHEGYLPTSTAGLTYG